MLSDSSLYWTAEKSKKVKYRLVAYCAAHAAAARLADQQQPLEADDDVPSSERKATSGKSKKKGNAVSGSASAAGACTANGAPVSVLASGSQSAAVARAKPSKSKKGSSSKSTTVTDNSDGVRRGPGCPGADHGRGDGDDEGAELGTAVACGVGDETADGGTIVAAAAAAAAAGEVKPKAKAPRVRKKGGTGRPRGRPRKVIPNPDEVKPRDDSGSDNSDKLGHDSNSDSDQGVDDLMDDDFNPDGEPKAAGDEDEDDVGRRIWDQFTVYFSDAPSESWRLLETGRMLGEAGLGGAGPGIPSSMAGATMGATPGAGAGDGVMSVQSASPFPAPHSPRRESSVDGSSCIAPSMSRSPPPRGTDRTLPQRLASKVQTNELENQMQFLQVTSPPALVFVPSTSYTFRVDRLSVSCIHSTLGGAC
jgi:hypothetical protein